MANIIYLSINGTQQGLISPGYSTQKSIGNNYQLAHEDEIFIYESVSWEHIAAGTSAWSLWEERIF